MKAKTKKNINTCICDNCQKEFEYTFSHEVIGKDENGGDIVQSYIICPHCKSRFNSYVEDSTYRDMLNHYRNLNKELVKLAKSGVDEETLKLKISEINDYEENTMKPYYQSLKARYATYKGAEK